MELLNKRTRKYLSVIGKKGAEKLKMKRGSDYFKELSKKGVFARKNKQ